MDESLSMQNQCSVQRISLKFKSYQQNEKPTQINHLCPKCKSLHPLTKSASKTQVGNGQYISVLFIILVIIDIHGHRFEIFMLVSGIHENVDLVLGIKNTFELEGIINLRESCLSFLNRSIPFFLKEQIILKPREQRFIKIKVPSVDEISGLVIVILLDKKTLKLTFVRNKASLDVTNSSFKMVIFNMKEMLAILDLRSIGFYKIKHGLLKQILSKYFRFESADVLCE